MRIRLRISTLGKYGHVQVLLPKRASFCGRIRAQPNICFIEPLRVDTPNGVSIGLAVSTDIPHYICSYCLNCTKFSKFILRKIIKIVAIRCYILKLKCTKFDFGWGIAPDPLGELTALPRPPSCI